MRKLLFICLVLMIGVSIGGCACYSVKCKHANFIKLMGMNIGSSIDNPLVAGSTNPKYLIGSKSLPNGNMENEYQDVGTCRVFFEFNPKARIIVAWHYQGTEQDCAIVP